MTEKTNTELLKGIENSAKELLFSLFRAGAEFETFERRGILEHAAASAKVPLAFATKLIQLNQLGNDLFGEVTIQRMADYDVAVIRAQAAAGANNGQ